MCPGGSNHPHSPPLCIQLFFPATDSADQQWPTPTTRCLLLAAQSRPLTDLSPSSSWSHFGSLDGFEFSDSSADAHISTQEGLRKMDW